MPNQKIILANLLALHLIYLCSGVGYDWGFYGHKLINETAVFTLPEKLLRFYKVHILFVREHSVAPDKRRYASVIEGRRHFIDLDIFGMAFLNSTSLDLFDALLSNSVVKFERNGISETINFSELDSMWARQISELLEKERGVFSYELMEKGQYDLANVILKSDRFAEKLFSVSICDRISSHGILPYHLSNQQYLLTKSFREGDITRILTLSSEIAHYIADACVPLHTTSNYNGQLTGQQGIHAFWETRIPELFAEMEYDLFVDTARYINSTDNFFKELIIESHLLVDELLSKEKEVRQSLKQDQLYCFDERGRMTVRTQCLDFARKYQRAMKGMVESRMRKAIHAVGSCWYTAWANAGFPDLNHLQSTYPHNDSLAVNSNVTIPDERNRIHDSSNNQNEY